jgi:hypothetical protein
MPKPFRRSPGCETLAVESGVMFFFFSNRMGCLGSIVVSLIVTGIILAVLGVF